MPRIGDLLLPRSFSLASERAELEFDGRTGRISRLHSVPRIVFRPVIRGAMSNPQVARTVGVDRYGRRAAWRCASSNQRRAWLGCRTPGRSGARSAALVALGGGTATVLAAAVVLGVVGADPPAYTSSPRAKIVPCRRRPRAYGTRSSRSPPMQFADRHARPPLQRWRSRLVTPSAAWTWLSDEPRPRASSAALDSPSIRSRTCTSSSTLESTTGLPDVGGGTARTDVPGLSMAQRSGLLESRPSAGFENELRFQIQPAWTPSSCPPTPQFVDKVVDVVGLYHHPRPRRPSCLSCRR